MIKEKFIISNGFPIKIRLQYKFGSPYKINKRSLKGFWKFTHKKDSLLYRYFYTKWYKFEYFKAVYRNWKLHKDKEEIFNNIFKGIEETNNEKEKTK